MTHKITKFPRFTRSLLSLLLSMGCVPHVFADEVANVAVQTKTTADEGTESKASKTETSNVLTQGGEDNGLRVIKLYPSSNDQAATEAPKQLQQQAKDTLDVSSPPEKVRPVRLYTNQSLLGTDNERETFPTVDLTVQNEDLWARIHNGFAMANLESESVRRHQAYFLKHPEYLQRMVSRSSRYLYYIVSELNRRHMPTEIALLPMVESAFNPMAFSRAKAAGLWQFIPSTGKNYNLTQNWWQDNRRDVIASTNAALDYLQYIYEMHGDWHLALASYNVGENAVARAIQRNLEKGLPTDFASLKLPAETKNYVPKLQAFKNILGNMQTLAELNLPAIPNSPYFGEIQVQAPIDVAVAAKLAEMSVEDFKNLNPAHNRPVMIAGSRLVLPAEKVSTFQNNRANYTGELSTWRVYTPAQAESLSEIANKFLTTPSELRSANGINKRIFAVKTPLLVPGTGRSDDVANSAKPITVADATLLADVVHSAGVRVYTPRPAPAPIVSAVVPSASEESAPAPRAEVVKTHEVVKTQLVKVKRKVHGKITYVSRVVTPKSHKAQPQVLTTRLTPVKFSAKTARLGKIGKVKPTQLAALEVSSKKPSAASLRSERSDRSDRKSLRQVKLSNPAILLGTKSGAAKHGPRTAAKSKTLIAKRN